MKQDTSAKQSLALVQCSIIHVLPCLNNIKDLQGKSSNRTVMYL